MLSLTVEPLGWQGEASPIKHTLIVLDLFHFVKAFDSPLVVSVMNLLQGSRAHTSVKFIFLL